MPQVPNPLHNFDSYSVRFHFGFSSFCVSLMPLLPSTLWDLLSNKLLALRCMCQELLLREPNLKPGPCSFLFQFLQHHSTLSQERFELSSIFFLQYSIKCTLRSRDSLMFLACSKYEGALFLLSSFSVYLVIFSIEVGNSASTQDIGTSIIFIIHP